MGSLRARNVDAMAGRGEKDDSKIAPSHDQARCIHPPFAECYAIQAFSIASDFGPQLILTLSCPHRKWSGFLAPQQHLRRGSWVHQASAYTCPYPSVPSHSKWQGLEPPVSLTLLSDDYEPEILRGEDADGLTQGSGAELSVDSVVPGNSPDIHGVPQL